MHAETNRPGRLQTLAYARATRARRLILPALLLAAGVYVSVGCIPIPSTQQYMINGKLKPSYAVGSGKSAAIRRGHTTIDEAIDVVADQLTTVPGGSTDAAARQQVRSLVKRSFIRFNGGRVWAFPYTLSTGYLLAICGSQPLTKKEFLVLEVDEHGIVTDDHTVNGFDGLEKFGALKDRTQPFMPAWDLPRTAPTTRVRSRPPITPATSQP